VTNFKGGSGKTTTAAHLAQYLALQGYRVLAIDLDPQASMSALFGYQPELDLSGGETLYGAIRYDAERRPVSEVIRKTYYEGLDLIPGNLELQEFEHTTPRHLAMRQRGELGSGEDGGGTPDYLRRPASTGAVKAMGLSLEGATRAAREADALRESLAKGERVIELDPAKVESSIIRDRLSDGSVGDEDFEALKLSLQKNGQQVPILVRPHSDGAKAGEGYYQAAYGHRRLRAARELGIAVKARASAMAGPKAVFNMARRREMASSLKDVILLSTGASHGGLRRSTRHRIRRGGRSTFPLRCRGFSPTHGSRMGSPGIAFAVASAIAAAALWGVAGVLSKFALGEGSPFLVVALQLGCSVIVSWIVTSARCRSVEISRNALVGVSFGVLHPGLSNALGIIGLVHIDASVSSTLWALEGPFTAVLAAMVLGERLRSIPMSRIIRFAVATAMRQEEICKIEWDDVDIDKRMVTVKDRKDPRKKDGNHQRVPMLDLSGYSAWEVLLEQRIVTRGKGRVFPHHHKSVGTAFYRACRELKIKDPAFKECRSRSS
jgi:hypothetical protein